jgi:hypothetical protein
MSVTLNVLYMLLFQGHDIAPFLLLNEVLQNKFLITYLVIIFRIILDVFKETSWQPLLNYFSYSASPVYI